MPTQVSIPGVQALLGAPPNLLYLYFPGMTGTIWYNLSPPTNAVDQGHPDGVPGDLSTNLDSWRGISGIQRNNRVMFIVGVFLGPNEPVDPAPARQNTNNIGGLDAENIIDFEPLLGQTFYIGDGRAAGLGNTMQRFEVPAGATRFFMGFADGWQFNGPNSWYNDNIGQFTVNYDFGGVPEPSTIGMGLAGIAALLIYRRRKRAA